MSVEPHYHEQFGEHDFDLGSFIGTNWKSKEAKETWKDLYRRMNEASSQAEWHAVLDDDSPREIALVNIAHQNMEEWLERCGRHGLQPRVLRYVEPYNGFAHGHTGTSADNPERLCFTAIATNTDVLDKAEEAHEHDDKAQKHYELGRLLGFPECCRNFFIEEWFDSPKHDPMYQTACNTASAERVEMDEETDFIRLNDPSPWVNVMWRYFGLRFITHMPCSFDCEASEKVAYHRGRLMEDIDEEAAHALKSWLDGPFEWSGHNGIAHIRNEVMAAQANTSPYLQEKRIQWRGEHDPGGKVPGTGDSMDGMTTL